MHSPIRDLGRALILGPILALLSCGGEDLVSPTTGSIAITTTTTGPEPDPDGYAISVNDGAEVGMGGNGTHQVNELPAGSHTLRLSGMAGNCTVEGDNPRAVSVEAGATATVQFNITCGPTTGSMRVTASTTGSSSDPDGYTITLDGADRGALAVNGDLTVEGLAAGDHVVGLSGIAANCQAAGENPRSITVTAGGAVTAAFVLTCTTPPPVTGTIKVTTSTSGQSPDPDGYAFSVDGAAAQPIGTSTSATVAGVAASNHSVTLSGLAGNCTVQGTNPRAVTVAVGVTAEVAFAVTCTAPQPTTGSIEISTTTSGGSPDPNGYTVAVDNETAQPIGASATLTISNVASGPHQVTIAGVASNCTVAGNNPRQVNVTAGPKSTVAFDISCPTPQSSTRIAWVKGNVEVKAEDPPPQEPATDIYVMNPDGSAQTNLTNHPGSYGSRVWSPNASKIAFTTRRDGNWEVYVMNADGSAQTRLTHNPADDGVAGWSPDGTKLLFVSTRDGTSEIYVMRADGTDETRLTHTDPSMGIGEPRWSPDGRKILFWKDFDFYVINADGSGETNITNTRRRKGSATWSPDGTKITFAGSPDATEGPLDIFVMNPDGSGLTRLTTDPADDSNPLWSPDGRKIAFESFRSGKSEIFVMNADGSGEINLTNDPEAASIGTWSPDGTKIAFVSYRDGTTEIYNREIYVMNADGSGQTRLTNDPHSDDGPVWSR